MTEIIIVEESESVISARKEWENTKDAYELEQIRKQRQFAYQTESDPIFFQWQREDGSHTKEDWVAKVNEINERFPYPIKPKK